MSKPEPKNGAAPTASALDRMDTIVRSPSRVLRMLTTGAELRDVLTALCETIEEAVPGMLSSILLVDRDTLRLGAAPSLPDFYNEGVDGVGIAAGVASCPNTAATGETTIAEDIQSDPFWNADYRAIAQRAGLRSCWSYPILSRQRHVVGTLAMYYGEPRRPGTIELGMIEASAEIAGIAIDHAHARDENLALTAQLRQIIDLVPHPIFAKNAEGRFLLANDAVARLYGVTVDELTGSFHSPGLQPDSGDLQRMLDQDHEVIASGKTLVIPEETFVHKTGEVFYYQTVKRPYVQAAGGEPAVLGVAVDITDRKRRADEREAELLRLHRQQEALVQLATDPAVLSGDVQRAFRSLTEIVAHTMEVERVSVWLLNDERSELHQIDLFERTPERHSDGMVLLAHDYPAYFEALQSSRVLDAHDACKDPRTREFREIYLEPLGITGLLDAPIRIAGEVVGVVCHERCSPIRDWRGDEIAFGGEIADQAAQAVIQRDRKEAEERLRVSEQSHRGLADDYRRLADELDARVRERTRQLGDANDDLRRLTSELLVVEERERRRLAEDLHDGPCQHMVLAQMKLAGLRRQVGEELRAEIEEVEQIVDEANRSSRSLTFQLSPPVLHDLGLVAAAEWLAEDLRQVYDVRIHVNGDSELTRLDERTRVILFRALRELLVNVGKHAEADSATVWLRLDGDRVVVVVEDAGQGFDPQLSRGGGFGLPSIRERLNHLGGTMVVESKAGKGTRVELAAPFEVSKQVGEQGEVQT